MTRPFTFKINAAEMYAEVHPLSQKEKALWITNFCNDLITLKPVLSYSEKLIAETAELIEKKKMAGALGGRPKKAEVKQRLSKTKAQPKLEVKVKEEETIIPDWMPLDDWNSFVSHRQSMGKEITERAKKILIKQLDEQRKTYDVAKLLNKAILHNWQGVFVSDDCKNKQQEIIF